MSTNDPFSEMAREEYQELRPNTFGELKERKKGLWAVIGFAYWIVAAPIMIIGIATVVGLFLLILPIVLVVFVLYAVGAMIRR